MSGPSKLYRSGTTVLRDHAKMYGTNCPYYAAQQLPRVVASVAKLQAQETRARTRGDTAKAQALANRVSLAQWRAQHLASIVAQNG